MRIPKQVIFFLKNSILSITIIVIGSSVLQAQSLNLKAHLGLISEPNDADSICTIPLYLGNYNSSGIFEGDTIAGFKLYDIYGDSIDIESELQKGKPILLVAGSYTCPVFRGKINTLNSIATSYANDLSVFVIYGVEAHPDIDISPYFGVVNTGNANVNAGILFRQPTTYGERKATVDSMLNATNLNVPVYLDGPCNAWWSYFGPAPNNAYLIDTNGIVFAKHAWFDKYPEDIVCDIDSLLGNPGSCSVSAPGMFSFNMISWDTTFGVAGATISTEGELVNTSANDVLILVKRLQNIMPSGWASSLCTDICLPTTSDSTTVLLPPGQTQSFTMYFYTGSTADTGRVRIGFRNVNNPNNKFVKNFWGITDTALVGRSAQIQFETKVFPIPADDYIQISFGDSPSSDFAEFTLFNLKGQRVQQYEFRNSAQIRIPLTVENNGLYLYIIRNSDGKVMTGKLLIQH